MKEANGDYRRMACHTEVSYPFSFSFFFSTSTLTISQSLMEQGVSYYADNLYVTVQYSTFVKEEDNIDEALGELQNK